MLPYESIQQAEAALGRELTFMETIWFNYSSNKPDYIIHFNIVLSLCFLYTILPLPYVFIELCLPNKANKYKLQRNSIYSFSDMFKCYKHAIKILVLIIGPLEISAYPVFMWAGIRTTLPMPSIWEVVCQISVYALMEDYVMYWFHRLFHTKWFYEKIHRVHHEYTSLMGFNGIYSHWSEVLLLGIPGFLGPVLVPGHIVTFWSWLLLRISANIDCHTGYDFPWDVTKYIPFYVTAEYHGHHHYVGGDSSSNFAPIFTYCDYIYGTDKGYKYRKSALKKSLEESMEKEN